MRTAVSHHYAAVFVCVWTAQQYPVAGEPQTAPLSSVCTTTERGAGESRALAAYADADTMFAPYPFLALLQASGIGASVVGGCMLYFICRRVGLYNKGVNEVEVKEMKNLNEQFP